MCYLFARGWSRPTNGVLEMEERVLGGWSLALIGNALGKDHGRKRNAIRGIFDEETRRKPLASAADALSYGI